MKILFILIITILSLSACQSAKDAMTLKKKASGDEFLVEKKSPLVLPPNYGELPVPGQTNETTEQKNQNNDIKVTLGNIELPKSETIKDTKPTSIEKSILKKIK
jgi:hypothetical protein